MSSKSLQAKILATIATLIALAAMVAAAPVLVTSAAATPADDCRNAIKTALADRRITFTEMQTIKAECANGVAPSGCLGTIKAAREDGVITQAELTAIKAACKIT